MFVKSTFVITIIAGLLWLAIAPRPIELHFALLWQVPIVVMGTGALIAWYWYDLKSNRMAMAPGLLLIMVVAAGLLSGFFLASCSMSYKLTPLKQEFVAEVNKGHNYAETVSTSDGSPVTTLDFGGRLDRVVERRNASLREHHYTILGGWSVRDYNDSDFLALYVPWK